MSKSSKKKWPRFTITRNESEIQDVLRTNFSDIEPQVKGTMFFGVLRGALHNFERAPVLLNAALQDDLVNAYSATRHGSQSIRDEGEKIYKSLMAEMHTTLLTELKKLKKEVKKAQVRRAKVELSADDKKAKAGLALLQSSKRRTTGA